MSEARAPVILPPATEAVHLPRLSMKQEAFVIAYMQAGIASKAYRMAYKLKADIQPRTVWAHASRTLAHDKVRAWIDYLRAKARGDNINSILLEFDQNRNGALEEGNYSAANGATRGKAQVLGLIPHDRDGGLPGGTTINILIAPQDEVVF